MKPFAIMFEDEDGMAFRTFRTLEEAQTKANSIALMGYPVTVFDYDTETDQYLEFYSI